MRAKIQGFVSMDFVVLADGSVGDVRIITSLDSELDQQAVAALKQWRFRPATKDGQPVPALTHALLSFKISGMAPPMRVPAGFDSGPPSTATTWTRDEVETNGVAISFAYPDGYARQDATNMAIGAVDTVFFNSIIVGKPSPLTGPFPFPLSVPELGRYSESTRQTLARNDRGVAIVTTGQATIGTTNWLWVELVGQTIPGLAASSLNQFDGAHIWSFSTPVDSHVVQVFCMAPTLTGEPADVRDRRLNRVRTDCSESLKRMSLTAK